VKKGKKSKPKQVWVKTHVLGAWDEKKEKSGKSVHKTGRTQRKSIRQVVG